ncbi:ribosome recycling factor-domain-containing protein [Mycena floridula]|nr:ribosome recycling factor-domain-containing protein [Mycena floridula]
MLFRRTVCSLRRTLTLEFAPRSFSPPAAVSLRRYATKPIDTSKLIPKSQMRIEDEETRASYELASSKMKAALDYFRKDCAAAEDRAGGRVSPSMLSPVRVTLPDAGTYKLEELATVGVRDGSTFIISLFDEANMKHVEGALYSSGLPNVVPQRQDARTIRIPIPKATVESRNALYTAAVTKAEAARQQIRRHNETAYRKHKFHKKSTEGEEFQKLQDSSIREVEKILADLKKRFGVGSK